MRARTFAGLMFLLLAFTAVLLVIAAPEKQGTQNHAVQGSHNAQAQVADGFMIWESVSTHLLGILQ